MKEQMDGDAIKGFGEVNGGNGSTTGREILVKTISYGSGKVKE